MDNENIENEELKDEIVPPEIKEQEENEELEGEDENKTIVDYLQDIIGQPISVGQFNAILQSLFAQYNKVFLTISDLYSVDLDETQEIVVDDEEDMYVINYDILDMDEGIVEITDVNIEN